MPATPAKHHRAAALASASREMTAHDSHGNSRKGMTSMLRNSTVAELLALQERVAELKRGSFAQHEVTETESAVAVALRQKVAQHELELDRVRRTVLKGTVTRALQQAAGERVAIEEAVLASEGGVSYRDRTRAKRGRMITDFQALLAGGQLDEKLANDVRKQIGNLKELDELDIVGPAKSRADELVKSHGLTPDEERDEADLAAARRPVAQSNRPEVLEKEFDRLDPDGNGYIEPPDLLVAINAEEERRGVDPMDMMNMRDVLMVINRLDGVGGQKDGVLELREFVAGMRNVMEITSATVMDRFFALRDEIDMEKKAAALAETARRAASFKIHHATTISNSEDSKQMQSRTHRLGGAATNAALVFCSGASTGRSSAR